MRLIDADALIEECIDELTDGELLYCIPVSYVDAAPTIDAVEVVRCRECDFSRPVYQEDGNVFEGPLHCFTGRGYQMNVFGKEYSVINPRNFCGSGRRKMDAEVKT